jgi:hypothetical protein
MSFLKGKNLYIYKNGGDILVEATILKPRMAGSHSGRHSVHIGNNG